MSKFKDRYVLGEGYPWAYGTKPYKSIGLQENPSGIKFLNLKWPEELWNRLPPKYRLVLERVEEKEDE